MQQILSHSLNLKNSSFLIKILNKCFVFLVWRLLQSWRFKLERLSKFKREQRRDYAPMSPIQLQSKLRNSFYSLWMCAKGDNRDFAPISSILLEKRCKERLDRSKRLAKGNNRDYAPSYPIQFSFKSMSRFDKLRRLAKGNNRN